MRYLTETLRIKILMMIGYGDRCRTHMEVAQLFREEHPDLPPISQGTVSKIESQFREHGHVKPLGRHPKFVEDDVKIDSLLHIQENPTDSSRQIATATGISHTTILKCFKKEKLHPYKLQYVQELTEGDQDRRNQFCEEIMNLLDTHVVSLENILFSDECTFTVNGDVNRQICRYWADTNPHWVRDNHTQHPQKVNVWAGIVSDHVVGPIFLENLTGQRYLELLRDELIPALAVLYPNAEDPDIPNNTIWFQQDGAPAHYARPVRDYLDEVFHNRWIGRRGFLEWPPRSPDLTPMDFFLWGYLKNKIFKTKPYNLDDLKERITTEMRRITPDVLQNVRNEFRHRLEACQNVDGQHFEQLL